MKTYAGLPHGMCTTHPETINPDLLAFVRGDAEPVAEKIEMVLTPAL